LIVFRQAKLLGQFLDGFFDVHFAIQPERQKWAHEFLKPRYCHSPTPSKNNAIKLGGAIARREE